MDERLRKVERLRDDAGATEGERATAAYKAAVIKAKGTNAVIQQTYPRTRRRNSVDHYLPTCKHWALTPEGTIPEHEHLRLVRVTSSNGVPQVRLECVIPKRSMWRDTCETTGDPMPVGNVEANGAPLDPWTLPERTRYKR